jgi:putative spermidine/putrescine transport system permease protein
VAAVRKQSLWAWLWIVLGMLYFFLPLLATLIFSLRLRADALSLDAYQNVLTDPRFQGTFTYSVLMAFLTIIVSIVLIVPTVYWVHLKLPRLRPVIEFITLLPFVIPAIVLVFGLLRIYSRPPLALTQNDRTTDLLLLCGYMVLSLPYMYRAVDTGLRAIDIRTLTEAAQSLGAGWGTILLRIVFPNLRIALLSGAFLTFATVIGEFTLASLLDRPAFGPYLQLIGANRAYEPAALAIISFGLTWALIGVLQLVGRGSPRQGQIAGAH